MERPPGDLEERIASWLRHRGLVTPALAFLQLHIPVMFVGSQMLLVLQPILDTFMPRHATSEWATYMADRAQIARLITRLEAEARGR